MLNTVFYTAFLQGAEKIAEEDTISKKLSRGAIGSLASSALNKAMLTTSEILDPRNKSNDIYGAKKLTDRIGKTMGLEDIAFNLTDGMEQAGFTPQGKPGVIAKFNSSEPTLAHEVGHLKNWKLLGKNAPSIVPALRKPATVSAPISVLHSAMQEDPSYNSAHINLAAHIPTLVDEATASGQALKYMIGKHGIGKGLRQSATLLPAFGSYASLAGAPYLITALRKKFGPKNNPTEVNSAPEMTKTAGPFSGLASKAFSTGKNLFNQGMKSMTPFDKAMTLGLPAAMTLPGMNKKQDEFGRSRGERLTTMGGNIAGGVIGQQAGSNVGNMISKAMPGKAGKLIGGASSIIGSMAGSLIGEKAAKSPFDAIKPKTPTQGYALGSQSAPQQQTWPQVNSAPNT